MKARVMRATKKNLAYLEWLPDDCPLPTAEPLGELLAWLTQLMGEAEHLHGMLGQEPAPWLLLCRDSLVGTAISSMPTAAPGSRPATTTRTWT
jgi:hypothetical protein